MHDGNELSVAKKATTSEPSRVQVLVRLTRGSRFELRACATARLGLTIRTESGNVSRCDETRNGVLQRAAKSFLRSENVPTIPEKASRYARTSNQQLDLRNPPPRRVSGRACWPSRNCRGNTRRLPRHPRIRRRAGPYPARGHSTQEAPLKFSVFHSFSSPTCENCHRQREGFR